MMFQNRTLNLRKANKYTSILIGIGFGLLFVLMLFESNETDFGGPQAQGATILFAAGICITLFAILGFPLIYKASKILPFNSVINFGAVLILGVLTLAAIPTLALSFFAFGFEISSLIRMYVIQLILFGIGIVPLAIFWLFVAYKK